MKRVMSAIIAASLLSAAVAAPTNAHDTDDDDVVRDIVQTHHFTGFDGIEVEGVYLLDIEVGPVFSVRTEARQEDAEWMDVRMVRNTLVLGTKDTKPKKNNRNNKGIRAVITLPSLTDLEIVGVATGHVTGVSGGDLSLDFTGVGDLTVSGRCDELDVDLSGVGSVDAEGLICRDVVADLAGMGALSVHATDSVEADVGGMGSIDIYGDPTDVSTDKSVFSSITLR